MRRSNRKRRGLWLPPDPFGTFVAADLVIATPSANIIKEIFINLPNAKGLGSNDTYALVGDYNEEEIAGGGSTSGTTASTLADLTFGYSLQRLVGKLFLSVDQRNVDDNATSTWAVTAGVIVRRVDQDGNPVVLDRFPDSYENNRDPWVWRRQWLLQNAGATAGGTVQWGFAGGIPLSNMYGPGLLDGPHVDQKTARTVKSEERLFLEISTLALDGSSDQTTSLCRGAFDFRFFGRVFQSAGNRNNASR